MTSVPGAVAIVIVLLVIPVLVCMSMAGIAALLGHVLWKDAEERFPGSELLDVNV